MHRSTPPIPSHQPNVRTDPGGRPSQPPSPNTDTRSVDQHLMKLGEPLSADVDSPNSMLSDPINGEKGLTPETHRWPPSLKPTHLVSAAEGVVGGGNAGCCESKILYRMFPERRSIFYARVRPMHKEILDILFFFVNTF